MDSPIFLAAYVSDATRPFARSELLELLAVSRTRNAQLGLTGLLLHASGNFLQAIEGPEDTVRSTLEYIERDRRHHHLQVLFFDHIPARLFPAWTMGFEEAWGLDPRQHPGLSVFMQDGALPIDADHAVMELLNSFRELSTLR